MSKRPSNSKPSPLQQRLKASFGKKTTRGPDLSMYQKPISQHPKSKLHPKKTIINQKKQIKPKDVIVVTEKRKMTEESDQKVSSSGTDGNVVIECMRQVEASIETENKKNKSPSVGNRRSFTYSKDKVIKNCDVTNLKNVGISKLEDCGFFTAEENITNSGKRLLFLEYRKKQVWINKSNEKMETKQKSVPKEIKFYFQQNKLELNYLSKGSRMPTQQTYDTSDSKTKMTPPQLTPRSIQQTNPPQRRNTFTTSQSVQLPATNELRMSESQVDLVPIQMQEQGQQQMFFSPNVYWSGNYETTNNMNYPVNPQNVYYKTLSTSKMYDIDLDMLEADGRTTVMIKNIPNKYTRQMLLSLFSKSDTDRYDFLYLPIDYDNSCNIGYAFINFTQPEHIRDFYKKYNGKRWESFNSDKICKLTYARMQGTSSLVEHVETRKERRRGGERGVEKEKEGERSMEYK